jgi:hypothetical protein
MIRIFSSHASEDRAAAHQIADGLKRAGIGPWVDIQQIHAGDELLESIAAVLAQVDVHALVHTPRALTKPWVLAEMRMARTRESEQGRPRD